MDTPDPIFPRGKPFRGQRDQIRNLIVVVNREWGESEYVATCPAETGAPRVIGTTITEALNRMKAELAAWYDERNPPMRFELTVVAPNVDHVYVGDQNEPRL